MDFVNNFEKYIEPFREISHTTAGDSTILLSRFCEMMAQIFDLTRTCMYVIQYNSGTGKYNTLYNYFPLDGKAYDNEYHEKFILRMTEHITDEPLQRFERHEIPSDARKLLSPENLCALTIVCDRSEKYYVYFYSFDVWDSFFYSEPVNVFITTAANFIETALLKLDFEHNLNEVMYNDTSVGVPNRMYFHHVLVQAAQEAYRNDSVFAVVAIDIVEIHEINNTYGHAHGDMVIKEALERVNAAISSEMIVSYFGNGVLGLYVPDVSEPEDVAQICDRLTAVTKNPVKVGLVPLVISFKMGISMFPQDGESTDVIIKNAEAAMYQAKKDKNDAYRFYSSSITEHLGKLLTLSTEIGNAIDRGEFELYYQAQLDIKEHSIHSVEALIRWNHPVRGILPPKEFIPFAESNWWIDEIDRNVLEKVCLQLKKWNDAGRRISIGVNISSEQFQSGDIVGMLADTLAKTGVPPELLELEISESLLIENMDKATETIKSIRALGVKVALDDFGSRYSSLKYITLLPFDILKLDRGFAMHMQSNPRNRVIIKAAVMMAKEMGLKVTVEGVENESALEFLRGLDCDMAQGYYINEPISVEEIERVIDEYNR